MKRLRRKSDLPSHIAADRIGGEELATWPLLEPLRRDPRIREYAGVMHHFFTEESISSVEESVDIDNNTAVHTSTAVGDEADDRLDPTPDPLARN